MKDLINKIVLAVCLLSVNSVFAHGPTPVSLQNVPIPPVPGLTDGLDPIVVNKTAAIALGKALFWDVNVGSDGMSCGSCHFSAGVDSRTKNQINPGIKSSKPSGQTYDAFPSGPNSGGPNYTLTLADFPLQRFSNPADKFSTVTYTTDDVVSSAGTFSGTFTGSTKLTGSNDQCSRSVDPIFHVNGVGTRRVEPRNAPSMINAVFSHRLFWDGRANNIFNGSSPWGDRDPDAGVWVKVNAKSVVKQRLHLENSALASLATGPALSDLEMSCRQRKWPDIGRKLLSRQPLQNQKVHNQDSVLGALSLSTAGNLKPGLKTIYKNLVTQAFNQKYWAYAALGPFGNAPGQTPYTQMEANFAMFFALSLQLYESTLVSDQAPIDLSPVDANVRPTWVGLGKTDAEIAQLKRGGALFFNNHCNLCHTGPVMSMAAVTTNATLLTPTPGKTFGPVATPIAYGPDAFGTGNAAKAAGMTQYVSGITRDFNANFEPKLMDVGFTNTAVGDQDADLGLGGVDDFGHPLSYSAQYLEYLKGNSAGIYDALVPKTRACDFIAGMAINLTNPEYLYFTALDDIILDGSREGVLRTSNCADPTTAYIPSVAAAQVAAAYPAGDPRMALSVKAAFKIPTLRNIELTGPYMHNGSMANLEQVLDFYARQGNYFHENLHSQIVSISSSVNSTAVNGFGTSNKADLIAYLKAFTDERVRYERAPFDHPEVVIPNGHKGNQALALQGHSLNGSLAQEDYLTVPAVGANGSVTPVKPFLAP
ncbi:MAG: cytochrome C peroxidase [Methylococcales bacterium]|nr:cytochrome C peroxidase [Methylococcales bacterium]